MLTVSIAMANYLQNAVTRVHKQSPALVELALSPLKIEAGITIASYVTIAIPHWWARVLSPMDQNLYSVAIVPKLSLGNP